MPADPLPALLARLEALAAAATPGPWTHAKRLGGMWEVDPVNDCFFVAKDAKEADAAFLAACSPDVIRRLVEAVRAGELCVAAVEARLAAMERPMATDPMMRRNEEAARAMDAALAAIRERSR